MGLMYAPDLEHVSTTLPTEGISGQRGLAVEDEVESDDDGGYYGQ